MPKKPTFTRNKDENDDEVLLGFPSTLPYDDPDDDEGSSDTRKAQDNDDDPRYKALEAKMSQMEENYQRQLAQLMATDPGQKQNPPRFQTSVNMKDLPDPSVDPEGYGSELARRFQTAQEAKMQEQQWQQTQQSTQQERINALWEGFQDKYPDYADEYDKVEFAAQKVVQQARMKNLDVNKYMFATTDLFMEDVAKQLEKSFGKPQGDPEPSDDDEAVGIFGGNASGGRPSNVHRDDGNADMMAELRQWQEKTGFHR